VPRLLPTPPLATQGALNSRPIAYGMQATCTTHYTNSRTTDRGELEHGGDDFSQLRGSVRKRRNRNDDIARTRNRLLHQGRIVDGACPQALVRALVK
jgi:hypothetical protein